METVIKLHNRQTEAFVSEATEILYGGAAGGGKSYLLRVAAIAWSFAIPNLQTYIFRRISSDLIKNHMEGPSGFPALLDPFIHSKHVKINWSDSTIEFWNKAKIFLCHCQYEKDKIKYQGTEIHVLLIDELTHFTASIYRYLRGRVRMSGVVLPNEYQGIFPRILCGSNPGGIGHNWVKASFIDGSPPMNIRHMTKNEGGMKRQYIPARLEDNPSLMQADPDYMDRLEGLGDPALVRAMKEGDWDIVAGGAFDDLWKRERHVVKPFDIPVTWRIDRSFDWGSSKPFSVGWWAESNGESVMIDGRDCSFPRGTLFRVAEYYGWNGSPNEGCKMLASDVAKEIVRLEAELFPGHKVAPGPADSSIFDADDEGKSIAGKMEEQGVSWEAADKRPGSRKAGFERLREMLKASLQEPMENPGFFVFEACTQFIRTIPVLPRDQRDMDDIDTNAEDHIYDETRYRVMTPQRFVRFGL